MFCGRPWVARSERLGMSASVHLLETVKSVQSEATNLAKIDFYLSDLTGS